MSQSDPSNPPPAPLGSTPILFAHRGARANAPENTMEAFDLAVELGATGIETDAWHTAEGVIVLDHDGAIRLGRSIRRTPIAQLQSAELPGHLPTWRDLLHSHGQTVDLSVDLKDPNTGRTIIDDVRDLIPDRVAHVWLCHPELAVLEELRRYDDRIRLVHSTRLKNIEGGTERWAERLAHARIDAINLRQPDWNGGMVALFHRFGVAAFMWDVQTDHELASALMIGVDGIYSDHVAKMVAAASAAGWSSQ